MTNYKEKQYNLDTMVLEECDVPTISITNRLKSVISEDNTLGEVFRIEFSESKFINVKKDSQPSLYKEEKCVIHKTIKGKGIIGRLIKKR